MFWFRFFILSDTAISVPSNYYYWIYFGVWRSFVTLKLDKSLLLVIVYSWYNGDSKFLDYSYQNREVFAGFLTLKCFARGKTLEDILTDHVLYDYNFSEFILGISGHNLALFLAIFLDNSEWFYDYNTKTLSTAVVFVFRNPVLRFLRYWFFAIWNKTRLCWPYHISLCRVLLISQCPKFKGVSILF